MMRQVGLIPSGCNLGTKNMLYFRSGRIYYASTLAVYVLDSTSFRVEKILSVNEKSITSTSHSHHDDNYMAISGIDGQVSLYKIDCDEIVCKVTAYQPSNTLSRTMLAWDIHNSNICVIVVSDPYGATIRVLSWDVFKSSDASKSATALSEMFNIRSGLHEKVTSFKWNPHTAGLMALGVSNGLVYILNHKNRSQSTLDATSLLAPIKAAPGTARGGERVKEDHPSVIDLQWDPLSSLYLLVAYQHEIILWDYERKESVNIFEKQNFTLSSVAWMDWTSGNFLSTNSKNGVVRIWNASQAQPLESRKITDIGIHNLVFEGGGSKRAVVACVDGSVLIYHMQKNQIEFDVKAGHTETIFDCTFNPANCDTIATCSYDGTVKLWDVPNMELNKTLLGASQVIYSVDFSPNGKALIASTVSGALIVWDVESEAEIARYEHHDKASYCVSWNKLQTDIICSTSADKTVVVFEIALEELRNSTSSLMGSRNRGKHIQQITEAIMKFTHPAGVFGCDWNQFHPHVFSTCCQDGIIRVFNYKQSSQPIASLQGHSLRAFNCVWSPINPCYIASGSDDLSICFWNITELGTDYAEPNTRRSFSEQSTSHPMKLKGHMSYVRALKWSEAIQNILLSGSWDSKIKIWNVLSGQCLHTCNDHIADVYAIVCHPDNPFTFVSCSRDTTLRVWEMTDIPDIMRLWAVWNGKLDVIEAASATTSAATRADEGGGGGGGGGGSSSDSTASRGSGRESTAVAKTFSSRLSPPANASTHASTSIASSGNSNHGLLGKTFQNLSAKINKNFIEPPRSLFKPGVAPSQPMTIESRLKLIQNYLGIFRYFQGSSGNVEIWNNMIAHFVEDRDLQASHGAIARKYRYIQHENDVIFNTKTDARVLEANRMGNKRIEGNLKLQEQLRQAAMQYLLCGDIQKYCQIMIDLGEWDNALAIAPGVSYEYWQKLSAQYSAQLLSVSSEKAIPYLVASGNDAAAIDFYVKRNQPKPAMVVAKMSEARSSPPSSASSSTSSSSAPISSSSSYSSDNAKQFTLGISSFTAHGFLAASKPLLAAAQHIASGEIQLAANLLMACEYYDLAFALLSCSGLDTSDAKLLMASHCMSKSYFTEGLDILSTCKEAEVEIGLMLSRYLETDKDIQKWLDVAQCPKLAVFNTRALENATMGSDTAASVYYMICQQYDAAASIAIKLLKGSIHEPLELSGEMKEFLRRLKYLKADRLQGNTRAQFLNHILWYSAHEAADIGLNNTACDMLRLLEANVRVSSNSFPITADEIHFHRLLLKLSFACSSPSAASDTLQDLILSVGSNNSNMQDSIQSLRTILQEVANPTPHSSSSSQPSSAQGVNLNSALLAPTDTSRLSGSSVFGSLTSMSSAYKCIQRIGNALSLPSLSILHEKEKESAGRIRGLDQAVAQGSVLPCANSHLQTSPISCISGERIVGTFVKLSPASSSSSGPSSSSSSSVLVASTNEWLCWKRVNPYAPSPDGNFG